MPEVTTKQSCYLPFTMDSVPCMGKAPKHDNVFVATGHGCRELRLLHPPTSSNIHRVAQLRLGHPTEFGKWKGVLEATNVELDPRQKCLPHICFRSGLDFMLVQMV